MLTIRGIAPGKLRLTTEREVPRPVITQLILNQQSDREGEPKLRPVGQRHLRSEFRLNIHFRYSSDGERRRYPFASRRVNSRPL